MEGGEIMKNKDAGSIQSSSSLKSMFAALFAALIVTGTATSAFAIAAPVAGSFMYDIYDIGVNQIIKGPAGFMAGVFAVLFGAVCLIKAQWLPAVPAVLGGAMLLKADAIVTSMGALF